MLLELDIKLETKSFQMKCPLMGACKSSVELQVKAFFHHFNLLKRFQSESVLVWYLQFSSERLENIF